MGFAFGLLVLAGPDLSVCQVQGDATTLTDTATVRTQTELVLVPVVVSDKSGAHVPNLRPDQFEVTDNGRRQHIASFEEVVSGNHSARTRSSGEYTNTVDDEAARRLTIVLFDLLNTPYLNWREAQQQLLEALSAQVGTDYPIALLTLTRSGISVVHDFTTDTALLSAALRKIKGEPVIPSGVDEGLLASEVARLSSFGAPGEVAWDLVRQRWTIDTTLKSLQALANALAGLPGRKALIWASAGFPFSWRSTPFLPSTTAHRPTIGSFPSTPSTSSYERTYELLNSANIAVYSVDVRSLIPSDPGYRNANMKAAQVEYLRWAAQYKEANTTTLLNFAQETGGKAFIGSSNIPAAFREALGDSKSYYLLGYYLNGAKKRAKWHKLRVKVAVMAQQFVPVLASWPGKHSRPK
ncbi:MAG TPA: VWA domain-containing protein [Terriglobales bacterium]|nr:VWA domain-containing protein [Terriglobales bacterium]